MNWIAKYRLNPDWFLETLEKEEIYEFIKNHDILNDSLDIKRDIKIDTLIDKDFIDPLEYLNEYIDILNGRIKMTMGFPQQHLYFIEDNQVKSRTISAKTESMSGINEFRTYINSLMTLDIYPYLILINCGKMDFRHVATSLNDSNIESSPICYADGERPVGFPIQNKIDISVRIKK